MKPVSSEVVTLAPYFKIKFECSNRAFYDVKSEICEIADKIGIEIQDGYISEKCDFEGDLEKIIIYNDERSFDLLSSVMEFYNVPLSDLPSGCNLVLSIF